jgi:hypothetical protein
MQIIKVLHSSSSFSAQIPFLFHGSKWLRLSPAVVTKAELEQFDKRQVHHNKTKRHNPVVSVHRVLVKNLLERDNAKKKTHSTTTSSSSTTSFSSLTVFQPGMYMQATKSANDTATPKIMYLFDRRF